MFRIRCVYKHEYFMYCKCKSISMHTVVSGLAGSINTSPAPVKLSIALPYHIGMHTQCCESESRIRDPVPFHLWIQNSSFLDPESWIPDPQSCFKSLVTFFG
jgi:hypothetical protein